MSPLVSVLGLSLVGLSFMFPNLQGKHVAEQQASLQDTLDVTLKLEPINDQRRAKHEPHRVCNKPGFKMLVTNNSNSPIMVLIFDFYYQNRPQLYKDGELVPYRRQIAELIESKDKDPQSFSMRGFKLEAGATAELNALKLTDWYEPLLPGSYRLINRHRFKIWGAWSNDSEELPFEILAGECVGEKFRLS